MARTKQKPLNRNNVLRSSEIGQYMYCSMAWYLQRCGYKPDSPLLETGIKTHINLGNTIDCIDNETKQSKKFATLGFMFLIISVIVIIVEVVL